MQYDSNSTGPPPPTAVLITNISPLTPNQQIRRHFSTHGSIQSFEPQIDKENGGALGIVFIKFNTHDEAKRCVEKENGKRLGVGGGIGLTAGAGEGEEVRVVFDGEGVKLKAVLKELDDGRKRTREEKKRKEREAKIKEANAAAGTPSTNVSAGQTPQQSGWWPPGQHPHGAARPPAPHTSNSRPAHLPQHPGTHFNNLQLPNAPPPSNTMNGLPPAPPQGRIRRPPTALMQTRTNAPSSVNAFNNRHPLPPNPSLQSHSSSSTPLRSHRMSRFNQNAQASPLTAPSRSPSPISRRPGQSSQSAKQKEHEAVVEVLSKNGFDHAKIDATAVGGSVTEEDVKMFFEGFKIDKVLQDHLGWYVTFQTNDTARRAAMVLNSGARTLARHSVTISVHPAPSVSASASGKTKWEDDELIDQSEQTIVRELKMLLEKDVTERVMGAALRKMVTHEKVRKAEEKAKSGGKDAEGGEQRAEKRGLKGLSFKKPNKRAREEVQAAVVEPEADTETIGPEEEEELGEEVDASEPPKKRRKKDLKKTKKVVEEDEVESEDDDTLVPELTEMARKRVSSEDRDDDEPIKKRLKAVQVDDEVKVPPKKMLTKKKPGKKATKVIEEIVIPMDIDFEIPEVAQVHFPGFDSSLSPSPSPVPAPKAPRLPSPPPDPLDQGICKDDEDLYFSRLALSAALDTEPSPPAPDADNLLPFRKHVTGSARTEGYYKISHAEKSAYVAQYALRATATEEVAPVEAPQPQHITSSRSNRANARRRALGLEEINQVQRAVALSKGETAAEMTIKFNQLQTRKKHLRFARSPIHDWGLYAMERISRGEMVIEYVGEVIRAQVADKREKAYERQGIGSSYLFRIDEDLVVDATKKGNLGYVFQLTFSLSLANVIVPDG
jgi:RNA recognition motif-containing protein